MGDLRVMAAAKGLLYLAMVKPAVWHGGQEASIFRNWSLRQEEVKRTAWNG